MSIQKKSLINTLKSTKKANVVKEDVHVSGTTVSPATKLAPRLALSKKYAPKTMLSKKAPRIAI
jgi:hypothetical protein